MLYCFNTYLLTTTRINNFCKRMNYFLNKNPPLRPETNPNFWLTSGSVWTLNLIWNILLSAPLHWSQELQEGYTTHSCIHSRSTFWISQRSSFREKCLKTLHSYIQNYPYSGSGQKQVSGQSDLSVEHNKFCKDTTLLSTGRIYTIYQKAVQNERPSDLHNSFTCLTIFATTELVYRIDIVY